MRSEPAAVLVAARDERARIAATVRRLREEFPGAAVVVGDDGSRDATAAEARGAGALVVPGPRLGKGEALSAAERAAPPGPVILCDADLDGDLRPLASAGLDLAIAAFAERQGGGFGLAKGTAAALVRARSGFPAREPLSGQRYLNERARAACFPLARGFGCELRMTIDAVRAGLAVGEVELPLRHRATGRDVAGFVHRGRQLADAVLASGPLAVNRRGNRVPLLGLLAAFAAPRDARATAGAVALVGLAHDLLSGPERGLQAHLRAGATTGTLKLVAIPLIGFAQTRSPAGALAVALGANAVNQLDTAPGRALKAFLAASLALGGGARPVAVLLLPYDLRERMMLGDAGSNALGAVVGLTLVTRLAGKERWAAVGALAVLNALGEQTSLGRAIERTPVLSALDRLGWVGR